MKFNELLKEIRLSKGLSQKDLGELMHIEPQTISNYERGTRECSFNMAMKFLSVLDIDIKIKKGKIIEFNNIKEKIFFEEKDGVLYLYADSIKFGEL